MFYLTHPKGISPIHAVNSDEETGILTYLLTTGGNIKQKAQEGRTPADYINNLHNCLRKSSVNGAVPHISTVALDNLTDPKRVQYS